MSCFKSWAARAARSLSVHLDRLHQTLDRLHGRLKEAVAEAVSGGAAVAVKDALLTALLNPDVSPAYESDTYRTSSWHPQQRYRDGSYASENPYRSSWEQDPYEEEPDPYERDASDDPTSEPLQQHTSPVSGRFGQAIAVGCQAVAWWLRRKSNGRYAGLLALGVGAVASVAAYFAGPVVAAAAALAASTVSLTAMTEAACRGAALLCGFGSS